MEKSKILLDIKFNGRIILMAEEIQGQENQEVQRIGKIKLDLDFLSPDSRKNLLAGLFLETFGDKLSPSALQEVQGIAAGKQPASEGQLANIEDEYVKSITDVAIWGKFPHGVDVKGRELVAPKDWWSDYGIFSPTEWKPIPGQLFELRSPLFDPDNGNPPFPQAGFIAVVPDNNPDYLCLSFSFFQDKNVRDAGHRYVRSASVMFRMPKDKAREFIKHVKEQKDGADIAERFLQKAVPGTIASDGKSRGISRIKTTELLVLDEEFQGIFFGKEFFSNYSAYYNRRRSPAERSEDYRKLMNFKSFAEQHVAIKKYSTPVGFGEPSKYW